MREADVVVVGAGPAGMAAASTAAQHGRSVILLDDNEGPGGQIWRGGQPPTQQPAHDRDSVRRSEALRKLEHSGATLLTGYRVFDANAASTLWAFRESPGPSEVVAFRYQHLVLATGARERFLPFPGWTLPGVFGAGGLQALVKGGFAVNGKRIVVAGSGPLLLAIAAHLREYGADIVCVAEQAPLRRLASFALSLWSHPEKIQQGIRYRSALGKAPYRPGCWPVSAHTDETSGALARVRLTDGVKHWNEDCDLIACGFHLVPNTEVASLLGCRLRGGFVEVDEHQRTSLANVYCAGEPAGIAGLDAALLQGEIAGLACAGVAVTAALRRRHATEKAFAGRLAKTFAVRPELRSLAGPETIVCRCEDVDYQSLATRTGWTDAKLQTRCGMGPCQGRICGPAAEVLFGWQNTSIRAPLFPVPLTAMCHPDTSQDFQ